MATNAPMLPGLGGAAVGTAPDLTKKTVPMALPNVSTATAGQTVNTPPAPAPDNSLKLGADGQLPAGLTKDASQPQAPNVPGTAMPQAPQPTVTQMLNTPQPTNDLAAKYGTMGTTAQPNNTDIADKYNNLHSEVKKTESPSTNPMRTSDMQQKMDAVTTDTKPQENPQAQFIDSYSNMNPVVKTMYDNIQTLFSSQNTRTSLVDEFTKLNSDQGIPADKLALMNIENVMRGTEDDIRNEITKSGGFATNSQVMALTAARNKVLMTQATQLQDQITTKEDYVKQIMDLTKADYASADKVVSEQLGLDEKVADMQIQMDNAATSNLNNIVKNMPDGYAGLAKAFSGNPAGMTQAERLLGLPSGSLSNVAFLQESLDANAQAGQFTLSPGSKRFDAQGNLIASAPATSANATNPDGTPAGLTADSSAFYSQMAFSGVNPNTLLPSLGIGAGGIAAKTAILNGIAQDAAALGIDGATFGAMLTDSQAKNKAYAQLQKQGSATEVNAMNANKDLAQVVGLSQKVDQSTLTLAVPILNEWLRTGQVSVGNNADVNNLVAVLTTSLTEYAKVVSGATTGAAVTNEANRQAQSLLSKGLSTATFQSFATTAQQEMNNRTTSYDAALKGLFSNIGSMSDTQGGLGGQLQASPKGTQSDQAFVAQAVQVTGKSYDSIVQGAPAGEIAVVENASGTVGYLTLKEFTPSKYTRM